MSTQRYISTSFWDDEWIQGLDPSEKLLYLYLMTNPLTNIAGVYKISPRRISFDTGFNADTVSHIMGKFETAKKVYRKDEFVIIPTWPKHQKWEEKTKIRDGIIACLQDIPKHIFFALDDLGYNFELSLVSKTIIAYKQRKKLSGTTVKNVIKNQSGKCSRCGESDKKLVIHHIKTIKDGGDNSFDNLEAVCEDCHYVIHSVHIPYMEVPNYSDIDLDSDLDKDKDSDSPSEPVFLDFVDPNKKPETKEDATKVFNRARALWNELGLKPECRNLIIPPAEYDVLQTFQHYSWAEIETAIKNYENHKKGRFGEGFRDPPPYGSLYGFLKTGVARYHDQGTIDQQFRTGPPPPEKTDNSKEMREREEQQKQWKAEAECFSDELIGFKSGFKDFLKKRKE